MSFPAYAGIQTPLCHCEEQQRRGNLLRDILDCFVGNLLAMTTAVHTREGTKEGELGFSRPHRE
ncbi:MAG: hypothetical protein U1A23_04045 [Candidatus Sungbacteria bacterium]|nr:hypothetical protein [Candidatus Sungbacteria bacterium]